MKTVLSENEVRRLAFLSGLTLSEAETLRFRREFSDILDYFSQIKKLRLKKVTALAGATLNTSAWREDKILGRPISTPRFFRTKRIL